MVDLTRELLLKAELLKESRDGLEFLQAHGRAAGGYPIRRQRAMRTTVAVSPDCSVLLKMLAGALSLQEGRRVTLGEAVGAAVRDKLDAMVQTEEADANPATANA